MKLRYEVIRVKEARYEEQRPRVIIPSPEISEYDPVPEIQNDDEPSVDDELDKNVEIND